MLQNQKNGIKTAYFFYIILSFLLLFAFSCNATKIVPRNDVANKLALPSAFKDQNYYKGEISLPEIQKDNLYEGKFCVLSSSPNGVLNENKIKNYFYIVFSKEVAPNKKIGKALKKVDNIKIEPKIDGNFFFAGQNALIFEPKSSLFLDGSYTVTVSKKFKSLEGEALGEDFVFSFTPRLFFVQDFWSGTKDSLLNSSLRKKDNLSARDLKNLYIETVYPIPSYKLRQMLKIKAGAHNLKYRIRYIREATDETNKALYRIKISKKVPPASLIQLYLNSNFCEGVGLTTLDDFKIKKSYIDYDYNQLLQNPNKPLPTFLTILFSSPVKRFDYNDKIFINEKLVDATLLEFDGEKIVFKGQYRNSDNSVATVKIKSNLKDIYGRTLDEEYKSEIRYDYNQNYFYQKLGKINYLPLNNPNLICESSEAVTGEFEIYDVSKSYNSRGVDFRESNLLFSLPFENLQKSYPNVVSASVANNLEQLNKNSFALIAKSDSFNSNKSQAASVFQFATVTLSCLTFNNSILVYATSLTTDKAASGVGLTLRYQNKTLSQTTADDGVAIFEKPFNLEDLQSHDFVLTATDSESEIDFLLTAKKESEEDLLASRQFNLRSCLFLERDSYFVGEDINLKVFDPNASSQKSNSFSLQLSRISPNPRKFATQNFYGKRGAISDLTFSLPFNATAGYYELTYKNGEAISKVLFDIGEEQNSFSLTSEKEQFIAGENLQLSLNCSDGTFANYEGTAISSQSFFRFTPTRESLKEYHFGPVDLPKKTFNYCASSFLDSDARGLFLFDTATFYKEGVRFPSKIKTSVTLISARGELTSAASNELTLYPSAFLLGAKLSKTEYEHCVKVNKKFYLDYQYFFPIEDSQFNKTTNQVFLEISPIDENGNKTGLTGRLSKSGGAHKGRFAIKIYKSGKYLVTVRTLDALGNLVISELPLYVLGKNSSSNFFQIASLSSNIKAGESFPLWVNIPKNLFDGERQLLLAKNSSSKTEYFFYNLKEGSQVISVPTSVSDLQTLQFALLGGENTNSRGELFAFANFCSAKISNEESEKNKIEIGELNIEGQEEKIEVELSLAENKNSEKTHLFAFTIEEQDLDNLEFAFQKLNESSKKESLSYFDTRQNFQNGKVVSFSSFKNEGSLFIEAFRAFSVNSSEAFSISSGESKIVTLRRPSKNGRYYLGVASICDAAASLQIKPFEISSKTSSFLSATLPAKIKEREIFKASFSIDSHLVNGKNVELFLELSPNSEGILFSSNKLLLSKNNNYTATVFVNPKKAGNYKINAAYELGGKKINQTFAIDVKAAVNVVSRSWKIENSENIFLDPLATQEELKSEFYPSILVFTSTVAKAKYDSLISNLQGETETQIFDNKVSALFPYFLVRRNFLYNDNQTMPISYNQATKVLNDIILLQNADGGYPLYMDKNYSSDFYTTLRIADLLEFSKLNYYDYTTVWSLTQYLKQAFKGANENKNSFYLRCYGAWVLSRYDENVILVAKNLLDKNSGTLAENCLASLAILKSSKIYKVDPSEYLEEIINKILRLYDPDLRSISQAQKQKSFYSYENNFSASAYATGRPTNGAVEAALVYLFLKELGEHSSEAREALRVMFENDFDSLTKLDSSFVLQAFYLASSNGDLNYLFPDEKESFNFVSLNYGQSSWLSFKQEGVLVQSKRFSSATFPLPEKKLKWSVSAKNSGAHITTATFSLNAPFEILPKKNEGYSIFSRLLNSSNKTVSPNELKTDELYNYKISISSNCGDGVFKVFIPLSSDLFELHLVYSSLFDIEKRVELKKSFTENGIELIYLSFPSLFDQINISFKPKFSGVFPLPQIEVRSLSDKNSFALSKGELFVVE